MSTTPSHANNRNSADLMDKFETESRGRYVSSLELASGVEVSELYLHDVSNAHLTELVRMALGWRQQSTTRQ